MYKTLQFRYQLLLSSYDFNFSSLIVMTSELIKLDSHGNQTPEIKNMMMIENDDDDNDYDDDN